MNKVIVRFHFITSAPPYKVALNQLYEALQLRCYTNDAITKHIFSDMERYDWLTCRVETVGRCYRNGSFIHGNDFGQHSRFYFHESVS